MRRGKISRAVYRAFTNLDYSLDMDRSPPSFSSSDDPGPELKPRRAQRVEGGGEANLAHGERTGIRVAVRNMSSAGFMAECPEQVSIGSYVTLEIPGIGTVEAQIRWQVGRRMGGMFLDPITLSRCEWTAEKPAKA